MEHFASLPENIFEDTPFIDFYYPLGAFFVATSFADCSRTISLFCVLHFMFLKQL